MTELELIAAIANKAISMGGPEMAPGEGDLHASLKSINALFGKGPLVGQRINIQYYLVKATKEIFFKDCHPLEEVSVPFVDRIKAASNFKGLVLLEVDESMLIARARAYLDNGDQTVSKKEVLIVQDGQQIIFMDVI